MKKWHRLLCYRRYVVFDMPHPFMPLPLTAAHRAVGWVCCCSFGSEGDPGTYTTRLLASSLQTTVLWCGTQSRQVSISGAKGGEENRGNQGVCARPYMEEIRLFQGQFVLKLNQLFWNIFQKKKNATHTIVLQYSYLFAMYRWEDWHL